MSKIGDSMVVGLALCLSAGACSSQVNPGGPLILVGTAAGGSGAGGWTWTPDGVGGGNIDGSGGSDGGSSIDASIDTPTDAVFCCPPDPQVSGCMHLGGASINGMCYEVCDFYDSINWRTEMDAQGCPVWRYDIGVCSVVDGSISCTEGGQPVDAGADG